MPAALANEIWSEVRRFINSMDRAEAADTVVSVLIDNDIGPDEIRASFKNDSDIKQALKDYLDDTEEVYDEEEELDDDESEYDEDY